GDGVAARQAERARPRQHRRSLSARWECRVHRRRAIRTKGKVSAPSSAAQVIQELLRREQIGRAETLREAVVDRLEAGDGIGGSMLVAEQPGKARRSAQSPA